MAQLYPTHFPQRTPAGVRNQTYDTRVGQNGMTLVEFGAPVALDADGILNDQSIAAATTVTTFDAAYTSDKMGRFGRNVSMVASGASTAAIIVRGRDFMQQPVREDFTLNGTTPVQGNKAFKYIDSVEVSTTTGATTIDVGWGNKLGVPFKLVSIVHEMKNGAVAANAGTVVAGLASATAATATNADVRGTYLPVTVIPDGTNTFAAQFQVDRTNLHGNAQYYA